MDVNYWAIVYELHEGYGVSPGKESSELEDKYYLRCGVGYFLENFYVTKIIFHLCVNSLHSKNTYDNQTTLQMKSNLNHSPN